MSPIINIDMVFLTLIAANITAINTKNAPRLEAMASPQFAKA